MGNHATDVQTGTQKDFSTDMNILKKTYRKLTSRKYNIGFVENTLEGILQGEPYRIKWMKHGYADRWFADPFILDVCGNEAQVLVEEFYDLIERVE